jgi:Ca2+-binding EF-hand superfamily protein
MQRNLTKLKRILAASIVLIGASAGFALAKGDGKHRAAMLEKYDANQDGKLDRAERAVMKQERMAARFTELDTNGDGVLSKEEFAKQQLGKRGRHHKRHAAPGTGDQ